LPKAIVLSFLPILSNKEKEKESTFFFSPGFFGLAESKTSHEEKERGLRSSYQKEAIFTLARGWKA